MLGGRVAGGESAVEFRATSSWFRGQHDRDDAMLLASGVDRDFDVLAECGEEVHESLHGEAAGAVPHEPRHVRLLDSQEQPSARLCQVAFLEDAVDLERQSCLQQLPLWIREAQIREHVAGPFSRPGSSLAHAPRSPVGAAALTREAAAPPSPPSIHRKLAWPFLPACASVPMESPRRLPWAEVYQATDTNSASGCHQGATCLWRC